MDSVDGPRASRHETRLITRTVTESTGSVTPYRRSRSTTPTRGARHAPNTVFTGALARTQGGRSLVGTVAETRRSVISPRIAGLQSQLTATAQTVASTSQEIGQARLESHIARQAAIDA